MWSVLQVLVFCFVDLLATDFLLAAIITYAVSKGLSIVRFQRRRNANLSLTTLKFLSGLSLAVQTLRQRLWSTDASSYESDARSEFLCHSTDQSSDNFILIIGANVVGVLTVLWLCKYFGIHVRFFLPKDRLNSENIWINLNKVETKEGNEYLHVWA